jgi:membrane associated rhomboid family serine protease
MGIYDRDYIRKDEPRRGGFGVGGAPRMGMSGLSRWSVNTWIIVACIAVFVVDAMLPPTVWYDPTDTVYYLADVDPATRQLKVIRQPVDVNGPVTDPVTGRDVVVSFKGYQIVDTQTQQVVGWQELQPRPGGVLTKWLHFSTVRGFMQLEVWRLIGFQFLHAGIWHLFLNVLGLFFFGPMVEQYLGSKRYLAFYLMCGISGALLYLILNFLGYIVGLDLAGLLINSPYTPLVGASAGVYGVLMAGAYIAPNTVVQLLIPPIPIKLKTFAYVLLGVAIFTVLRRGYNAGGQAAHIGGAIAGAFFIRRPGLLHDFFDDFSFGKGGKKRGGKPKRQRFAPGGGGGGRKRGGPSNAEVDRILSKVGTEGLQSLSDREKEILRKASEEQRRG